MKIRHLLAVIVGAALLCTGCNDDDERVVNPAKAGDLIVFGGSLNFENANQKTRTVYGDRLDDENGTNYTEIKWYKGDQVLISSKDAITLGSSEKGVSCQYTVDGLSDYADIYDGKFESEHSSGLSYSEGATPLCWGSNEGDHLFYGVYPSPNQLKGAEGNTDKESVAAAGVLKLDSLNGVLTGYLPNRQVPQGGESVVTEVKDDADNVTGYVVQPAMRYAYMVAKETANPTTDGGNVTLTFNPVVTAVEITLVNNSKYYPRDEQGNVSETPETLAITGIESFSVSSSSIISGGFTTTIGDNGSFTNKLTETEEGYKTVFIPATISKLAHGQTVKFTAFMILDDSNTGLEDLTVSVISESGGVKSAKLTAKKGETALQIVEAKKKNFIKVPLELSEVTAGLGPDNWVSELADTYVDENGATQTVYLRDLSIPGAGGAASDYFYANNPEFAQQSLTITQQWNRGIRCFEFAVDRVGSTSGATTLADELTISAGRHTDMTLGAAVNEVITCLNTAKANNANELAMVIITYENLGGWSGSTSVTRNPATFMSDLTTFWNSLTGVDKALFDPETTTVNEARGKLFCIARPTSTGLDDFTMTLKTYSPYNNIVESVSYTDANLQVTNDANILVVNGWGSLKDKWIARGYTSCVFHRGNHRKDDSDYVTYCIGFDVNAHGRPFDVSSMTTSSGNAPVSTNYTAFMTENAADFNYITQVGTSKSGKAWVQEWARVSPEGGISGKKYTATSAWDEFYWAPTIEEKKLRIKETLEYAMAKKINEKEASSTLFVNSLCGYFIDPNISESFTPHTLTDYSGYVQDAVPTGFLKLEKKWRKKDLTLDSEFAGMEGNIETYSKYINNWFYNHLLDLSSSGGLTGGMGIILMDRVSNDVTTNPGGYYIPRFIWSNNKFNTSTTATANGLSLEVVADEEVNNAALTDGTFTSFTKRQ